MNYTYPYIMENGQGERLIVHALENTPDGERLVVENFVQPGHGPIMHTHLKQDEELTVTEGYMGYQVLGQPEQFAGVGETVLFSRGVPHRFWNAGNDVLRCTGYITPPNTFVFFLTAIFEAQKKSGKPQPELFDTAFLLIRYRSEYEMAGIPKFVRKVIIPLAYALGMIIGKYGHFRNAPEPLK